MDYLPDIERAAVKILSRAYISHPVLERWISALCSNPDEHRHLDDFDPGNAYTQPDRDLWSVLAEPDEGGWPTPKDETFSTLLLERRAHSDDVNPFNVARDRLLYILAYRLWQFRISGRPSGDIETPLPMGLGTVITSLAAAVAYHTEALENLWAERFTERHS